MPESPALSDSPHPLGAFLRAKRERLQPAELGLPAGKRRRTAGLRREEVAALCGISTTWITWIEQGRSQGISSQTLAALAQGLRLSQAERTYLFTLAARADPATLSQEAPAAGLQALVDHIRAPAYVLDRHWDVHVWNAAAQRLFVDWLAPLGAGRGSRVGKPARTVADASSGQRNLLRYACLHPQAPRFIVDWPHRLQRLIAEYRADTAGAHDDPVAAALVAELRRASVTFERAWQAQEVRAREGGLRQFLHPRLGELCFEQTTLGLSLHPGLKLSVLVPT